MHTENDKQLNVKIKVIIYLISCTNIILILIKFFNEIEKQPKFFYFVEIVSSLQNMLVTQNILNLLNKNFRV